MFSKIKEKIVPKFLGIGDWGLGIGQSPIPIIHDTNNLLILFILIRKLY
jgi:hypothetical protein